ncbi:hypothetical protein SCLCIDRAFT_1224249 [Scleroderma citrinum Foug A]|uniref:Uncharacterized protein n=1 Tax=Scleroderma citrinum Foug A TaxID=1036808 RepID=A0A0C3CSX8_9AGAM|nr:hypothetical protein SCLCIDRAFT_1224249 [Scleroderma citrinum Foug A]
MDVLVDPMPNKVWANRITSCQIPNASFAIRAPTEILEKYRRFQETLQYQSWQL